MRSKLSSIFRVDWALCYLNNINKELDIKLTILQLKEEEKAGIGRIFRELRKTKRFEIIGDIILYKTILNVLSENGHQIEERSIVRHFKNIDIDDYDPLDKGEIIKNLKEGYQEGLDHFKKGKERLKMV